MKRALVVVLVLLPSLSRSQAVRGWRTLCDGKRISIPMMSKSGQLLAGSYQGTLRVFRIAPDASACEELFDTKAVTGKADFSRDDRFLIYVTRAENPITRNTVDAIVLADLHNKTTKPIIYGETGAQLAFPGFANPDRIVVYDQASKKLLTIERTRVIR